LKGGPRRRKTLPLRRREKKARRLTEGGKNMKQNWRRKKVLQALRKKKNAGRASPI